jgi:hypothetical protein
MAKANGLLPALEPGNIRQRFTGHNSQSNGHSPKSFTPSIKAFDITRKIAGGEFLKNQIGLSKKQILTIDKIAALNGIPADSTLLPIDDIERRLRLLEEKLTLKDYIIKNDHIEVSYGEEINCYWHMIDKYHMGIVGKPEFDILFYGYYLLSKMGYETYLDVFHYALEGDMEEDEIKEQYEGHNPEDLTAALENFHANQSELSDLVTRSNIVEKWIESTADRNSEYFYDEIDKNTPLGLFAAIIDYLDRQKFHVFNYESTDPDRDYSRADLQSQFIISWDVPDAIVEYLDSCAQEGYDLIQVTKKFYTNGRIEKTNIDNFRLLELLSHYSPKDQNFKFYGYSESTLQSYQSLIHLYLGRHAEFIHRNRAGQRWHIESGYTPQHVSSFGLIEDAVNIDGFPAWRDPEGYDLLQRVSEKDTDMEVRASLPGVAV